MKKFYYVARSSVTGEFVSLKYARRYPRITVMEKRKK